MLAFGLTLIVAALGVDPVAPDTTKAPTDEALRESLARAVRFLAKDAVQWRSDHKCASCHHGVMTVWTLAEGKRRGLPVDSAQFDDFRDWTKGRFLDGIDQPRDPRPGWNLVKLSVVYLSVMSETLPEGAVLDSKQVQQAAGHIARHQEQEGFWSMPPPANGPPPVFESRETMTLWACLALERRDLEPSVRGSLERGRRWLQQAPQGQDLQSALLRLALSRRAEQQDREFEASVASILARQRADGGWAQVTDAESDAFATGQALYFLNLADVNTDRAATERALSFLLSSQRADGSWPMVSRAQPGEKPFTNPTPITYFGSAWAALGLLRSLPER